MNKEEATRLIGLYGKAWEGKDADILDSIFTEDAIYIDPREPENIGIDAIKDYWRHKVVEGQEDINFEIKNIWIDGDVVIAEWHTVFKDIKRNLNINMTEVAIFTVKDGKFNSLREYYKTIKTPLE